MESGMKTLRFGAYEIEADVEATREYYSHFDDEAANRQPPAERLLGATLENEEEKHRLGNMQAYRNYKEACKALPAEEKDFFDALGVNPGFVTHFFSPGIDRKRALPCSGGYPVVGRFTKSPEEICEDPGEDLPEEPTMQVGRYSLSPVSKEAPSFYDPLPEPLREKLVLIQFFIKIPWLLDEECMMKLDDLAPRWWQIKKRLARAKKNRLINMEYREAVEGSLQKTVAPYNPVKLSAKEAAELCIRWFKAIVPLEVQKEAKKRCFSTRKYRNLLWYAFSFEFVPCDEHEKARELFDAENKSGGAYILIQEDENLAYAVDSPSGIKAADFDNFLDIYVISKDFRYTYVHTHEDSMELGPYFYKKQ